MSVRRVVLRVLYWLLVLAVSLLVLVGLVLFLESRDPTRVGALSPQVGALATPVALPPTVPGG